MFATARKKKVVNVAFPRRCVCVCVVYSLGVQILKCGLVFDNEDIKVGGLGKEDPGAVVLVVDNMWKEECDFNAKPGLRRAEFNGFTFPAFAANAFNSDDKLALNRVNFSRLTRVKTAELLLLCRLKIVWDPRVHSV